MHIDFDSVAVEREGRRVLDIPWLRLAGTRTTAILGPNGAGKTTLLRVIAGLERPLTGRVFVGGAVVQPRRQHVAYVFQEQVFLRQSVGKNLELALRLCGVDRRERRARIEDALDMLGIAHLIDRRADRLSGGEGRRVSLARALCVRAPVVLLDEPLAGLDGATYSRLLDELPLLLSAFNATTVVVTHNRDEALRLAQDLVVVVNGRVHAAGDKREVAANPRDAAVAEVLGCSVLRINGQEVAVPPGALKAGGGAMAFAVVVDDVLDLVGGREIVGRIGDVRVRVPLGAGIDAPPRGERMLVHAEQYASLGPDKAGPHV